MRDFGDLNKLITFAREKGISVRMFYCEAVDEMTLEIISAAKAENFYVKRARDVDDFISMWHKTMEAEG